jgi:hypothetical protein
MDCKQFSALLDGLSAEELRGSLPEAMTAHGNVCGKCGRMLAMRRDSASLDEGCAVPADFSQSWRKKIKEEARTIMKPHAISWKAAVAMAATAVFILGGTLITGSRLPQKTVADANVYNSTALPTADGEDTASRAMASGSVPEYAPTAESFSKSADQGEVEKSAKIIRTADFTLATRTFDLDMEALKSHTAEMGGRIESSSVNGDTSKGDSRYAYLTLRIPALRLDEFITGVQSIGRVVYSSQGSQDVSDSYYDIASRLSTQETKMERLQSLMGTAADLSDLIELESAIADTQYLIDSYKGQLQGYDSRVNESAVNITLYEESAKAASEAQTRSIGERILLGFRASLDAVRSFLGDMVVFLTVALPWMFGAIVIIGMTVIIIRRKRK